MKEQETINSGFGHTWFSELSADQKDRAISLLTDEFYAHNPDKGREMFDESIRSGQESALCLLDYTQAEVIGVMTTRPFSFEKIAPQLFIEPTFAHSGELESVRLRKLVDLLSGKGLDKGYQKAVELAYITVDKKFRGKGLSNDLFRLQIEEAKKMSEKEVIFGLARSEFAGTGLQASLTKLMLDCERSINGETNGKVNVCGEWIDAGTIGEILGVDLKKSNENTGSSQSIHLLKKHGAIFVGFSKNMAPVWAMEG